MRLTEALKKWAIEKLSVAATASDDEFKAALSKAIAGGTLTIEKYTELTTEADPRKELADIVTAANAPLADAMSKMADAVTKLATKDPEPPADPPADPPAEPAPADPPAEAATLSAIEKAVQDALAKQQPPDSSPLAAMTRALESKPRVKSPVEGYSSTKGAASYPDRTGRGARHMLAGQPVVAFGRNLDTLSECDHAVSGAWLKLLLGTSVNGANALARMTDHDRDLIQYALREVAWNGPVKGEFGPEISGRKLTPFEQKTILDDATSGGTYAVPVPFDNAIITTPKLFGELFPLIDLRNLPMGASVASATWTQPVFTPQTEGSAHSLVSTASIIGNFDTNIFATACGVEFGLDWESDSPVDWGRFIQNDLGQALMVWLDEQIAIGDGSTEPTGIQTKTGVGSVTSDNGTSGPLTTGDFETLAFTLDKAMRAFAPCVFVSTDEGYRRARSIVTATNYQTRAMGMDHSSYMLLEWPCKIQDSITEGTFMFWCPRQYIMYRRLGMQVKLVTEGITVTKTNTNVIFVRARFGGQPALASSIAKMTTGPLTG